MTQTNNNEFTRKKKLRLSELLKSEDENVKKQAREEKADDNERNSSDEDVYEEEYKNLFSGKLNVRNLTSSDFNHQSHEDKSKEKEKIKHEIKKNASTAEKLLSLLPPPKMKSNDTSFLNISSRPGNFTPNQPSQKFRTLANPDKISSTEGTNIETHQSVHSGNMIELDRSSLVDSNWELKYISQELGNEVIEQPSQAQRNKNNIKSIIADYKTVKANQPIQATTKYGKISTKSKYGW